MYHLMGRIKESQYAKLCLILAFCCITVFIFINLSPPDHSKGPKLLKLTNMSSLNNDEEPAARGEFGRITGGLGQIYVKGEKDDKDDKVSEIVGKIKPVLEEKSGKKFESLEVIHYRPQVVAGMNYFVKAKAKEVDGADQIIHLRIYRDLKGELELTAYQLNKLLGDELDYFQ